MKAATNVESFAQRLTRLMSERNVTIGKAVESIGVPKSTIQGWREGKHPTDFLAVQRLAQLLKVSFEFLQQNK